MTYKLPTKKQAERFQKYATDRLIRLGFKKVEGATSTRAIRSACIAHKTVNQFTPLRD